MVKRFFLQILFVLAFAVLASLYAQEPAGEAQPQGGKNQREAPEVDPVRSQTQHFGEEEGRNGNLDIVFLIDSSRSMAWIDPGDFRKAAINAFLDISQDRGGDRIAIFQFAGWNETESHGATVFPLTEIPHSESDRERVISQAKEAVTTKIVPFGNATDFNYAFQKCVLDVVKKRKEENSANSLWVILLTDGEMDVVEEKSVRQEYREKAAGSKPGERITREALKKAAAELFETEVIPLLVAEKTFFVTCINLSSTEPEFLKTMSEKMRCSLIFSTRERIKGVFIEALAALPLGFHRDGLSRGFSYTSGEVQPAETFSDTFHLYEGTRATRLVIFASSPSFSLDIINPDDGSIVRSPNVSVAGEGEIYRTVTLKNFRAGDYKIVCANNSESAIFFEKIVLAQFEFLSYVDVSSVLEKYLPAEEIILRLGLKNVDTFAFVKDPLFIREAQIIIEPLSPDGTTSKPVTLSFAGENEAQKKIAYRISPDSIGGEWSFNIRFALAKQTVTGKFAYASEPVRLITSVVSPIIQVGFSESEAFVEQKILVTGKIAVGAFSQADIASMPFIVTAVNQASGSAVNARLDYNPRSGTLSANFSLPESGKWRIKENPAGYGKIVPSADAAISVKDRTVRIFRLAGDQKCPASEIIIAAKDPSLSDNIILQPDLAAYETAEVSLSYNATGSEEHALIFSVDGAEDKQGKYDISGSTSDKPLSVKLSFKRFPRQRETIGSVLVTCRVSDVATPIVGEIPVLYIPLEIGFFLWLLLTVCAFAACVVALIWWWLILPQFARQQLVPREGPVNLLRDMRIGKRHALGTDQLPGSLVFKLIRPSNNPKCLVRPEKNSRAFVDGVKVDTWTPLTHGCSVSIQSLDGRQKFNYRYFDRQPTAQELQAPETAAEVVSEDAPPEDDVFVLAEEEDFVKPQEEPATTASEEKKPTAQPKPQRTEEEVEEPPIQEELEKTFDKLFNED